MVLAYADREEHAMGLALSLPALDHSALVEEVKETTALVILALRSMMYISEEEASLRLDVVVLITTMCLLYLVSGGGLVRCGAEVL